MVSALIGSSSAELGASHPCSKYLQTLTPSQYQEGLLATYGKNSMIQMHQWLSGFPICLTGVGGDHPPAIHLKDAWIEFLLEVSKPHAEKNGLHLFRTHASAQSHLFLAHHYWRAWRELGILSDTGELQTQASLFHIASRFRKAMRRVGVPMEVYVPQAGSLHWRGKFLSSKDFAVSVLNGSIPIDDLHSIFFHLPDLMDETRRKFFLLSMKFLEIEELYREIKKTWPSKTLSPSEQLFHENFEGTRWPDSKTLAGYIQLMTPTLRGTDLVPGWSSSEWVEASHGPLNELIEAITVRGFPKPEQDHSHWKMIMPVVQRIALSYQSDLGSFARFFYSRDRSFESLVNDFVRETESLR